MFLKYLVIQQTMKDVKQSPCRENERETDGCYLVTDSTKHDSNIAYQCACEKSLPNLFRTYPRSLTVLTLLSYLFVLRFIEESFRYIALACTYCYISLAAYERLLL